MKELRFSAVFGLLLAAISTYCAPIHIPEGPFYPRWAYKLDELERYREKYGRITVQKPSVWGRARLTQHQEEYEREMAAQLGAFELFAQGSRSTTDQRSFAFGLGVGAGLSGSVPEITNFTTNRIDVQTNALGFLQHFSNDIQQVNLPTNGLPGFGVGHLGLEPTESLNQRARYISHLQELRRINEADDTADAPGYAMYLFRMPVAAIPGSLTKKGYGAEINFNARVDMDDDFLANTFRQWVINDLVAQLAPAIGALDRTELSELLRKLTNDQLAAAQRHRLLRDLQALLGTLIEVEQIADKNLWASYQPGELIKKLPASIFREDSILQRLETIPVTVAVPEATREVIRQRLLRTSGSLEYLRGINASESLSLTALNFLLESHGDAIQAASPNEFRRLKGLATSEKALPNDLGSLVRNLNPGVRFTRESLAAFLEKHSAELADSDRQRLEEITKVTLGDELKRALQSYELEFKSQTQSISNILTHSELQRTQLRELTSLLRGTRVFADNEIAPLATLSTISYPPELTNAILLRAKNEGTAIQTIISRISQQQSYRKRNRIYSKAGRFSRREFF
jgi:hypothetical protein